MSNNYAIEMIDITKSYINLIANDNITLKVKEGTVHALLGENGAGKSTLMSILFGLIQPDIGSIKINNEIVKMKNPNHANRLGIGMVHQHFKLIDSYTALENIILGFEPRTKFGHIDYNTAKKNIEELVGKYRLNIDINANTATRDLTVSQQQQIEIIKTLYRHSNIIILDEPSGVLSPTEIDDLLLIIKRLKDEGKTIILITHKMKEIKAVADYVSVIRKGKMIDTIECTDDLDEQKLAELMVGRPVNLKVDKKEPKMGIEVLRLENLYIRGHSGSYAVENLSLTVHKGEILGLAGVDGNGQSELIKAIYGLIPIEKGNIFYCGININKAGIKERIDAGMALSPEDRQKEGLVLDMTIGENIVLKNFRERPFSSKLGFLNFKQISKQADHLIKSYDVRCGKGSLSLIKDLSGGNQQKVLLAREFNNNPKLLTVCHPTRGLDVGAIEYIHKEIIFQRDTDVAVLLVSFELEEILALCNTVAVISHGQIKGVVDIKDVDIRAIGAMMTGMDK